MRSLARQVGLLQAGTHSAGALLLGAALARRNARFDQPHLGKLGAPWCRALRGGKLPCEANLSCAHQADVRWLVQTSWLEPPSEPPPCLCLRQTARRRRRARLTSWHNV